MVSMKSWFDRGIAYERIMRHFPVGEFIIRIAVGFFSVKGWSLIRQVVGNKQVKLIVGINGQYKQDVKSAKAIIVQELRRDLSTGIIENRRQLVQELIDRIESGKFQIVDGRAMSHHAKLYIVDDYVAIQTSANLSEKGLKNQVENGTDVFEENEINHLIRKFDYHFASAKRNLTQEVLQALKDWLKYSSPWDAYLKTLLALEDLNIDKRYIAPATYQIDMIAETLDNIRQYNGSMLVASTGLGKTVVSTHVALQLVRNNEITNVLVLCPKRVKRSWNMELFSAGIASKSITYQALDQEQPRLNYNLRDFLELKKLINKYWLIIIDESHFFRNSKQNSEGFKRRSFQELLPLVQKSDCKVLLLTGSPYSKSIDNLNDQLLLLPHTQQDTLKWEVEDVENFRESFVVSQLTTPHVAKEYGEKENDGSISLTFGNQKRYIPSVTLHRVDVPLFLENEVAQIVKGDLLTIVDPPTSTNNVKTQVQISCASSPEALCQTLKKVICTPGDKDPYDMTFLVSQSERKEKLTPLINRIEQINSQQDIKLLALKKLLEKLNLKKEKTIIFCERHATVVYLVRILSELVSQAKIFGTIQEENGVYSTKSDNIIQDAIKEFAPVANKVDEELKDTYNVFISTDAYGVGINLQDAPVAMNYDLSWTPIEPTQRAGRILRPWIEPRTVEIYSFVPVVNNNSLGILNKRWKNLVGHHSESKKILDLPVISVEKKQVIENLSDIASKITIQSGKLDLDALASEPISSSYLKQHVSTLYSNRDEARQIKGEIVSSKIYPGSKILIYVLLKYKEKYHWAVYYPGTKKMRAGIEKISQEQLLDWLKCQPDTNNAFVDFNIIEPLGNECIKIWCNKNKVNPDNLIRECTVYLKPKTLKDKPDNLMSN